ncbi:MAG: hypothetical protein QM775_07735 [Pirellulales bacterium]
MSFSVGRRSWCWALALALSALGCNDGGTSGGASAAAEEEVADKPPATLKEAVAVIDLREFPLMDKAESVDRGIPYASFSVPNGDLNAAIAFAREKLGALGWQPSTDPKLTVVNEYGAQLFFTKDGHRLYSAIGISPADKNLNFTVFHLGTTDARKLPHFAGVEFSDSIPARTISATTAKPDDVQKALREPFAKAGWREFKEPTPKGMEGYVRTDRPLKFFQNGTLIDIMIMPVNDKTNIYTNVKLLRDEWPIDASATYVEMQDAPLLVFYPTKLGLDESVDYCRKELTSRGWKIREADGGPTEKGIRTILETAGREPIKLEVVRNQELTFVMISEWDGKPIEKKKPE